MLTRRDVLQLTLAAVFAAGSISLLGSAIGASPPPQTFTGIVPGVAVGGYDAVAYFTEGRAVQGRADLTLRHAGATWRFASEANRAAFRANPARYAPQFGGHCAWAAAQGYVAPGDPQHWRIVDGRLYLNYDASVQARWEADMPGFIRRAGAAWARLTASR